MLEQQTTSGEPILSEASTHQNGVKTADQAAKKAERRKLSPEQTAAKRALYRLCLRAGLALILLVTVCKTAMLGISYDYEMHFFERGLPLLLLEGLVTVTVLFAFAGILLFRKCDFGKTLDTPSSSETLFSALCGFFLFATVIMEGIYIASGLQLGRYTIERSWFWQTYLKMQGAPVLPAETAQTLQALAILCAIPGGIYFLYAAFSEKPNRNKRAILGIFFLLWSVFCLLVVNFDMSIPMNSPERLGPLTAFVAIMLFAAAELRCHLGKGRISLLFCAGMLTALFGFSDGLPTLLYSFAGRFEMGVSTIYACVELSIAVYAFLRLSSFRYPVDEVESEPAGKPGKEESSAVNASEKLQTAENDGDPEDAEEKEEEIAMLRLAETSSDPVEEPAAESAPEDAVETEQQTELRRRATRKPKL